MDSKKSPPSLAQPRWRYSRILLLALGFFLFSNQEVYASHMAGADITYVCTGPNQYTVTLTLYRDCTGIGMPTSANLQMTSASCGLTPASVNLPLDTTYEISQLCPAELPNSACNNGTNIYPGYEIWVYKGPITFPATCSDWIIGWNVCCRNANVAGIFGALTAAPSLYIEGMINSFYQNSSPTFTSNPIPYFCHNQCYQYNQGAFDPEGDTLRYAMTCPLNTPFPGGTCIPHKAGMSPTVPLQTNPLGVFSFNDITGQMNFCTAANLEQFGALAVTVYNIVNGDTIGYVQRDIQLIVLYDPLITCTSPVSASDPNVLAGGAFDTSANTFIVCAGTTLTFDFILYDDDGNTIVVNPLNTNLDDVFGATNWTSFFNLAPPYRPDSVQMFIQITAVPANLGVNNFTIGFTDNACPIPGDVILGYNLIVPGVEVSASDTTICPGIAQQLQMYANSFSSIGSIASGTFQWSQVSGPIVTYSNDTINNPIVFVPGSTSDGDSIVLEVTFITAPDPVTGALCTTSDSVVIYLSALPLSLDIAATDTSLCPNNENDTISFSTAIGGPGIDLVNGTYFWSASPANYLTDLSSTTINGPDAIVSGGQNDQVTYTISYTYGDCVGSDDITLTWRPATPVISASVDTICPGDTTSLMAYLTDTVSIISPGACSIYTVAPITFAPVTGTGTNVFLTDDALSGNLPIGFSFDFYCNTYTQFRISSNGFITFDLPGISNGCCTGQIIPDPTVPNDLIALAWEDLNPSIGGVINYFTVGTAPNRQLVVNYLNVPRFGGASNVTGQIVIHEGTNYIDIHTTSVSPDGGTTQGIESALGTFGMAVPGRNQSFWSATNDAYRFSPGIAFLFGPIDYTWSPGFAVSDANAYNPDGFPQGTTTFTVEIDEAGCVLQDSIEIFVQSLIPPPTITCGTPFNQATSVLFEWGESPGAAGWEYSLDSGSTWIPVPLQDSSLLITGLVNGDCANILVRGTGGAGPCPTNAASYLECCTTPCPMPNSSLLTHLSCFGSADGSIEISVSGGVLGNHPDFSGTLYDTSGLQVGATSVDPTAISFGNLSAGTYYAYLQDTFGCFTNSDTVVITEPDTLILSLDTTTLTTCFTDADGTATVQVSGGTVNYSWLWASAAGSQTTMTATGLVVGTYPVTVTDANGCTDVTNITVSSPFPAAASIVLTATASGTCTGDGTATVFSTFNMVGNANNYTFAWSNGGSGTSAVGLVPGLTTVTVTDINGCEVISSVNITGSPTLTITALPFISPGCGLTDGQITVAAVGDTTGYTYQWSPNANGQTTALITGLGIGAYSVTVTGASNGCTSIQTLNLVNTSALNIVGFNPTNPSCGLSDGSIEVLTIGASGALDFLWTGGSTVNPVTGLAAGGPYFVTVTDPATNCSDILSVPLTEDQPTATFSAVNNASCNISNGSITVLPAGTPGPFTYLWNDPLGQTTATAQGLAPGNSYSCTVTYQGCSVVVGPEPINNDVLQISIADYDDLTCNGDLSSYINLSLDAGNTPAYLWSNGETTMNISGMGPGTYSVTATSGTCVVTQSVTVQNISLSVNAWVVAPGQKEAVIQVNDIVDINGGQSTNHSNPIYNWTEEFGGVVNIADSSAIATTAEGLASGITWLYFTDTAGTSQDAGPCVAVDSILITVESYMGMPTAFTPNGDLINDTFGPVALMNSSKVFRFEIYNRWGQLLFNDPIGYTWDGTYLGAPQPTDVYIYIFEYAPDNGNPIEIRGEFTLIR